MFEVIDSALGCGASWELWFGFMQMFCTQECLAVFLPKVDVLLRSHTGAHWKQSCHDIRVHSRIDVFLGYFQG